MYFWNVEIVSAQCMQTKYDKFLFCVLSIRSNHMSWLHNIQKVSIKLYTCNEIKLCNTDIFHITHTYHEKLIFVLLHFLFCNSLDLISLPTLCVINIYYLLTSVNINLCFVDVMFSVHCIDIFFKKELFSWIKAFSINPFLFRPIL